MARKGIRAPKQETPDHHPNWKRGRPAEPPTPKSGPAVVICCACGHQIDASQVADCPHCKTGRTL